MAGSRFTLYKRPTSKAEREKKAAGKRWTGTYVVRWKLPDGRYSTGESTGKTNRAQAIDWCEKQLKNREGTVNHNTTLGQYSDGYYDWPDGKYAIDRRAGGHRASYRSAQSHRLDLENHVFRFIPRTIRLIDIGRIHTKKLRDGLVKEGRAPSTINHIVSALSIVLQGAEEDDLIAVMPRIYRAGGTGRTRGILTHDEKKRVFEDGTWFNTREKVANELAAATGCRQSEILGLQPDRVFETHIDISHSWNWNEWCLQATTKNGDPRVVPIAPFLYEKLTDLILDHPHKDGPRFVFYDDTNPNAPYDGQEITKALYRALASIGIDEEERKRRKIVYHSWRHYFDSVLIDSGVPEVAVNKLLGWRTRRMTLNYYHPTELEAIRRAQEA